MENIGEKNDKCIFDKKITWKEIGKKGNKGKNKHVKMHNE